MTARWMIPLLASAMLPLLGCVSDLDLGHHVTDLDAGGGGDVGGGGGGGAPPDAGAPDASAPDSGHPGKLVFVTDGRYIGDLRTEGGAASGPAGGDAICMTEAASAVLGGVYRAWLSTSTENARDRIAPVGPWRMVNDVVLFPGHAVVGSPLAYPKVTASGTLLFNSTYPEVWTGTTVEGVYTPDHAACSDWESGSSAQEGAYGIVVANNSDWTDYGLFSETLPCTRRARLYCFEQ